MTGDDAEDHRLPVEHSQRRTRDAEFSAFMAEAEPLLVRTAWLLCGDGHRAEELVQTALVRTYVAWPRAKATDPLAYARRVIANARIDSWRKHRREQLLPPEDLPPLQVSSSEHAHAEREELVQALLQLSVRRRRVIVLRYLLDLPERQVADDLGISLGTVKSTASRGLAQLRVLLTTTDAPTTSKETTR